MTASILIAEDDDDIRSLLRLYLEGEGYRVLEASDGAAALRLARGGDAGYGGTGCDDAGDERL